MKMWAKEENFMKISSNQTRPNRPCFPSVEGKMSSRENQKMHTDKSCERRQRRAQLPLLLIGHDGEWMGENGQENECELERECQLNDDGMAQCSGHIFSIFGRMCACVKLILIWRESRS